MRRGIGSGSAAGFKLKLIEGGRLAFLSSDGKTEQTVRLDVSMLERQWYRVHCTVDLDAQSVTLTQTPVHDYAGIEDGGTVRSAAPHTSCIISLAGTLGRRRLSANDAISQGAEQ